MAHPGRVETCVGFFILAVLAGILYSILAVQSLYDPTLFKALELKGNVAVTGPIPQPPGAVGSFAGFVPEGIKAVGGEETFDSETLSDKIDGKAELYLSAGFIRLTTQRFSREGDPKSWFELYVYEMGDDKDAFSVYSLQKRKDGQKAGLGAFAYTTENALFFVSGSKYIEIVAAGAGLGDQMFSLAKKLEGGHPAEAAENSEFALFPTESLDQGSISLHLSDVFGFAGLDNVYTAKYQVGSYEVTAFISKRKDAEESAALAADYSRFLLENGASELGEISGALGLKLFKVFDTFEAVLQKGPFFAGAHEVENREAAEQIAVRIYKKLEGAANE